MKAVHGSVTSDDGPVILLNADDVQQVPVGGNVTAGGECDGAAVAVKGPPSSPAGDGAAVDPVCSHTVDNRTPREVQRFLATHPDLVRDERCLYGESIAGSSSSVSSGSRYGDGEDKDFKPPSTPSSESCSSGTITREEWDEMIDSFENVVGNEAPFLGIDTAHPYGTSPEVDPLQFGAPNNLPGFDPLFEDTVGTIVEQATMREIEKAIEADSDVGFVKHSKKRRRDEVAGTRAPKKVKLEAEDVDGGESVDILENKKRGGDSGSDDDFQMN